MYYEFYIDQFFTEQLLTGYLLLVLAAAIGRISERWQRMALGSLFGAAASTAFAALGLKVWYPAGMILSGALAFGSIHLRRDWKRNLSHLFSLLAATICFGGALEALAAVLPLPVTALAVLAAALTRLGVRLVRKKNRREENTASVTLFLGGKSLTVKGLIDTGNRLREPLTGRPVSIANREALRALLEDGWEEKTGYCLIPYHSLGMEKGWLRGVTFDEMRVEVRKEQRMYRRPVVAVYEGQVSAGKDYEMILSPDHAV